MTTKHQLHKFWVALLACTVLLPVGTRGADKAQDQFAFAEALFIQMDYQSAVEEYQTLIKKHPDAAQADQARFRIGDCFFRMENFKQAAGAYVDALQNDPKSEDAALAQYNLGRAYTRLETPEKALTAFRSAAAAEKTEIKKEAMIGVGETLIELKQFEEAVQAYEDFLAAFPNSEKEADARFALSWTQMKLERNEDALENLHKLTQENPEYGAKKKVRLALSDCYTALDRTEEAGKILQSLQNDTEIGEEVTIRLAWNMYRTGKIEEAAEAFTRFAASYPKSPSQTSALFNAGMARFETENYQAAAELFKKVMEEAGQNERAASARYWLGLSLFNLGEYETAANTLEPLNANPEGITAKQRETLQSVLARALAKAGRAQAAVDQFNGFLKNYPDSPQWPETAYVFAVTLAETGNLDAAVALLDKLITEHPDAEIRDDALFALSEYLCRQQKHERALPHLQTLAKGEEVAAKILYRLAWTYHDLGNYQNSLETFTQLANQNTEFKQEAFYMAGRNAEMLETIPVAIGHYQQAADGNKTTAFQEKALYRLALLAPDDNAEKYVKTYAKLYPDGEFRGALILQMADTAFAQNDIDTAMQHYTNLLKHNELDKTLQRSAAYGLAWCHLKKGALDEADNRFAALVADKNTDPAIQHDAVLQRAEIAYQKGDINKANAYFKKAAGAAKVGARARYMLGWCARKLDDQEQAVEQFRQLLNDYPDCEYAADARLRLGETLSQLGKHNEARDILKPLVSPDPDNATEEPLFAYAHTLAATNDWATLLEVTQQQQTQYPESERAYLVAFWQGKAYQGLGILDKAEDSYRKTVEATDTVEAAKAQFNIGTIYFARKQYADAAKNFLRVEMLYDYPEIAPHALYRAVQAFHRADATERAETYLKKLRTTYGDSIWAGEKTEAAPDNVPLD